MAEPPAAAPAEMSAPRGDVLLATKLHMPAPRPGLVPRPRLGSQLDAGLGRGLVLVYAPAGYGKTVLLADWARCGQRPVAWLSLDAGDNDPARFWRHTVAALDRVCPGIGERVGPLLGPPAPLSFEGPVTALVNDLAAGPGDGEVLLVLDDYHLIDSQPVHASVGYLLEHRPPGLRLVVASRSDPPLALARLRARGELAEVRAAELRFTAGEAAAMLRDAASADLPDAAVTALAARTEGWAAGLQLAGLSLRGQEDVAGFVAAFTGATAMCWTSWPRRCSSGSPGRCARSCWRPRCWSGCRGSCATRSPAATAARSCWSGWSGRACSWCRWMRYGVGGATTTCSPTCCVPAWRPNSPAGWRSCTATPALGVRITDWPMTRSGMRWPPGEVTWGARLIEQYFDEVYNLCGEGATIQRWLSALPADLIRCRPRLLLAQARLAIASVRVEEVEALLDAAERATSPAAEDPFEPTVGRADSQLVNVPALIALCRSYLAQLRGDAEATAVFSSQALAESREGERLLDSVIRWNLAMAEWLRGRLADAERAFASGIAGWQAAGESTMAAWGGYELSQVQCAQGRLDAAVRTCRQALESTAQSGRPPLPTAGPAYVGLGEVAYQRNELDTALRHVTEGIVLCRQFVYTPPLAVGLVTLAWIRQASGDPSGALDAMGEAMQASPGPPGLFNPVPAQRARLLLAQGDLAEAARWAAGCGLSADDEPDYPREPGHLVLARVLLAQGLPGQALALLDRLRTVAAAQDRAGGLIEVGALRALALAAGGDEAAAVTALAGALMLACPQGNVRVFADEGAPMAALLGRLIAAQRSGRAAAQVPLGCLARLQRAFDSGPTAPNPRSKAAAEVPGIVEPLTGRGLEVLEMLAAGRSNQAIAGELVVTLDTVKKHVTHVLGKLGAANRTEAVARARELNLL